MAGITILAFGKLKGPYLDAAEDYAKRLRPRPVIRELAASGDKDKEAALLLGALPQNAFLIALDERGASHASRDFAALYSKWRELGRPVVFALGGADGFAESVRRRADALLALGPATWPHQLCRVMLLEQVYRAESLLAGHPYHRD